VDPLTLKPLYGGLVASRYHQEWTDIEYRVYSATIDWNLGGVTLESVTSYGEFSENFQRDVAVIDALGAGIPTAQLLTLLFSTPGTVDTPLSGVIRQTTATDKFTQEFRLVSPEGDRFEWLAGAYYTDEDSGINPQNVVAVIPGTDDPAPGIPLIAEISLDSTYEEVALFANGTWHMSPKLDFSLGGRWSNNEQTASQVLGIFLLPEPIVFDDAKSSENPLTYSASLHYNATDTRSIYLRYATGFRPGGPNVLPPGTPPGTPGSYDSDKLTNFELGFRTGTADGRYSFDAAIYHLDWQDVQLFAVVNGVGINANGGTAVSDGVEFTAAARVVEGLKLALTGAYTDAELTQDTDPLIGGLDGNPLPFVPDWTLGLSADYEWAVMGDATAYVGGQLAYTGDRYADFGNREPDGSIRKADAYTTVDLRAGLLRDRWSVELYGKNVTNERGINDIIAPGVFPNGAAGIGSTRPRTIGLTVGFRF
jgi:outer membrane receptor protein involved in Fe transport